MSSTNPTPPAETVEEAAERHAQSECGEKGVVFSLDMERMRIKYGFIAGAAWKEPQLSEEAKALREENARLREELQELKQDIYINDVETIVSMIDKALNP